MHFLKMFLPLFQDDQVNEKYVSRDTRSRFFVNYVVIPVNWMAMRKVSIATLCNQLRILTLCRPILEWYRFLLCAEHTHVQINLNKICLTPIIWLGFSETGLWCLRKNGN